MAIVVTPNPVTIKCYPADISSAINAATYTSLAEPPVFDVSNDTHYRVVFVDTPTQIDSVSLSFFFDGLTSEKKLNAAYAEYGTPIGEPGFAPYAPFAVAPPDPNEYGWQLATTHTATVQGRDADMALTAIELVVEYYVPGTPPPATPRYAIWGESNTSIA